MSDYGLIVTGDGYDALTAEQSQQLLNTRYAHAKLDISNDRSFQNIRLNFINNPPEPSGVFPDENRTTLVATFEHGYDYTPSYWSLINTITPAVGAVFWQEYFQDEGVIGAHSASDDALFYIEVTATNVNFYVRKFYNNVFGTPNNLVGCQLLIRLYLFAEGVV